MPALDIFSSSAFTMVSLTDAINRMPYVPGRIGQLGLFREQGVSTTSVMIEEREGSLNLVETTARGAPAIQNTTNKRKARSLVVPHIALEDTILADEVQNVRAFGSESMLEGVQAVGHLEEPGGAGDSRRGSARRGIAGCAGLGSRAGSARRPSRCGRRAGIRPVRPGPPTRPGGACW